MFLDADGMRIKLVFDSCCLQTELEECTETLSQMIARPYLRTPRAKIIQTAHLVQRKRHEFVSAIAKGLVPPDTSPNWRKRRKKFSVELDVSGHFCATSRSWDHILCFCVTSRNFCGTAVADCTKIFFIKSRVWELY